jgi:hypothetical protein
MVELAYTTGLNPVQLRVRIPLRILTTISYRASNGEEIQHIVA